MTALTSTYLGLELATPLVASPSPATGKLDTFLDLVERLDGLPRPIAEGLSGSVRKILAKPEIKARFEAASAELEPSTPDEFRVFIARQLDNWGRRVREAGIQPE